jgi:hypothetical protein
MPMLLQYKVGTLESRSDPDKPGSLAVRHFYRINGKAYSVEFRRQEDPGPYRVFAIDSAEKQDQIAGQSNSLPPTASSPSSTPSSSSAVEGFSANWLLADQEDKHNKTMRALADEHNRGDMDALKMILRLRSIELAQAIDKVTTGSYSISDKQKMLKVLEMEKDWADEGAVSMEQ